MRHLTSSLLCSSLLLLGCSSDSDSTEDSAQYEPPVLEAPAKEMDSEPSIAELMEQLGANDRGEAQKEGGKIRRVSLLQAGVSDISPLKGLSLIMLDLTSCPVEDLSPLEGMPLEQLYLEGTKITDLTPLAGMPLTQLNLFNTQVKSITGVEEMPLEILWIPETPVTDLSPLRGKTLQSVDFAKTKVTSLEPLSGMASLQRLNMAGSDVTDLTPLEGLSLQRLIFTPSKITAGIETIRNMPSLQQLGMDYQNVQAVLPPAEFWAKYDAGELE